MKTPTIEKHVKCPYLKDCTSKIGFCHRHTTEAFADVNGRLEIVKVIHDCNKPLIKV